MATNLPNKTRQVCQLFCEQEKAPFCDEIGTVQVKGVVRRFNGGAQRVTIKNKKIVIDPYTTTKEEIAAAYPQFKEFYIYATSADNGRMLEGGHNWSADEDDDEEEEEDDEPEVVAAPTDTTKQQMEMFSLMRSMMEKQLESADKRSKESLDVGLHIAGALNGGKSNGSSLETTALVDAMRSQMRTMEGQLEDARRSYRDELNRRDKDLEDLRVGYRDDIDRRRREFETERGRYERDLDERRTKYDREMSDLRVRLEKEIGEGRTKYDRDLMELRQKYEKRIDELEKRVEQVQKENFELRREIADIPDESDKKAAPPTDDMPKWVQYGLPVAQQMFEYLSKNAPVAPPSIPPTAPIPAAVEVHPQQQAYVPPPSQPQVYEAAPVAPSVPPPAAEPVQRQVAFAMVQQPVVEAPVPAEVVAAESPADEPVDDAGEDDDQADDEAAVDELPVAVGQ